MAKITECLIKPDAARVLKALTPHLKNAEGNLTFLCPRCKKPVQPIGDHFEHLSANPECPLTPEQRALHPAELGEPRKGNNASCRICEALNRVNAAMGKCRVCRTDPIARWRARRYLRAAAYMGWDFPLAFPICHNLHHIKYGRKPDFRPRIDPESRKMDRSASGCRDSGRGNWGISCFSHQQFTSAAAGQGDGSRPSVSVVPRKR